MNHVFRQFSMGAVAIAIMQAASAQVSMTNIVPMQIAGQGTEIRVMFNGLPPQPQAYQLENPSRLILDFDKAQQGLKQSKISVATNEASSVDVTSDDQRSRLTVNLKDAGAFTTRVEGNTFILKLILLKQVISRYLWSQLNHKVFQILAFNVVVREKVWLL